ncbi:hypothetical protein [Oricola sp.]|uniref:hypothetical protein n=1 Tax=Oricola sp. TaxID=1979950 RepID=UPI003514256B
MTNPSRKSGTPEPKLTRSDIASDEMGRNSLQGDDQANIRNERQAVPDVKTETDGVIESFRKLDKDVRAREDLGKGNRHSEDGDD